MRLSILSLLLTVLFTTAAAAQVTIGPGELYSSENVLAIHSRRGIGEVRVRTTRNVRVTSVTGAIAGCPKVYEVRAFVETADRDAFIDITIVDCRGRTFRQTISMRRPFWALAEVDLGEMEVGSTRCERFYIKTAETEFVDSITVADSRVMLNLPGRMPTRIGQGGTFEYSVCFSADSPGIYKFPVTTWMRRAHPAGGFTTYPVSDTGIVRVVPQRIPPPVTIPADTTRGTER